MSEEPARYLKLKLLDSKQDVKHLDVKKLKS